ncbi:MAG TPA: cytochrome P450 [Steroidobacteraceae bacterium]|jgi:cytochrome P450|nr:cytochrome P450 [Steroidobacteraceae bacterium]
MATAYVSHDDLFNAAAVRNARAVDDALREAAPVVKLARENITMLARYEHVAKGLQDWKTFSSTSRPWHDPNSVRPEILLTDDPPRHTQVRAVIANALSPRALSKMSEAFRTDADALVRRVKEKSGTVIDAVAEITQPFVYKVLPDLLGVAVEGREHMYAFGHMVWATMGPMNELFHEAMKDTGPVIEWATKCCNRENLAPNSLGMQMFEAADRGEITQDEAKLLVGILLSAAADTTVMTMATAIRAFCLFPDQYQLVRKDRSLVRAAFEESLRWDSPSRMAGRITMRDVEIEGVVIPKGERCGLMFAAANRDPRRWQDPDRFDVLRDNRGHVGWGYGVHSCVGRVLAGLEADALLGAVVEHIERFEPAGEPEPWMTTIGHGPAKLPVRFFAA